MSAELWAIHTMKKYQLGIDFCLNCVVCSWDLKYNFGSDSEYKTYFEAIEAAAQATRKRTGEIE